VDRRIQSCSPSKVSDPSWFLDGVATAKAASREVRRASECCCVNGSWAYRFPTPAVLSSFPKELAVSTAHRPRLSCPNRFILPYASRLFRVLPARTRPAPPGVEHLPWGWPSLFATSAFGVYTAEIHPCRIPSSTFLTSSTFLPPLALWVCFTPQPRPGFSLQGFSLPHSRCASSTPRCPRVGWRQFAADSCPPAPRSAAPPSGPCSVRESVAESTVFSRRPDPIPSWAFPPPGSPSRRRANAFTPAAARGLGWDPVESLPQSTFSVPSSSSAFLSRGCRPARGFRPAALAEFPRRLLRRMVCGHSVHQRQRCKSIESRINLLLGTPPRYCDVDGTRDWSRLSNAKTYSGADSRRQVGFRLHGH
jgi:hypothetical protein